MSADFVSQYFHQCSHSELERKVRKSAYTGEFSGMKVDVLKVEEQLFFDEHDAHQWLRDNTDKRGTLAAIKIDDKPIISTVVFDNEIETLQKQISIVERELSGEWSADIDPPPLFIKVLNRFKASKSEFSNCSQCNSRLSVAHIKGPHCPVCGFDYFLFTEDDLKHLDSLELELKELSGKKAILKADKKLFIRMENQKSALKHWKWLVGGWRSS